MDHSNGHAEVESASTTTTDVMAITTVRIIRTKPDAKVAFIMTSQAAPTNKWH